MRILEFCGLLLLLSSEKPIGPYFSLCSLQKVEPNGHGVWEEFSVKAGHFWRPKDFSPSEAPLKSHVAHTSDLFLPV
jgi:hypothetical protein